MDVRARWVYARALEPARNAANRWRRHYATLLDERNCRADVAQDTVAVSTVRSLFTRIFAEDERHIITAPARIRR